MVSLRVENVALRYPVPWRFSLARRPASAQTSGHVGGHVEVGSDGRKYVTALDGVSFSLASGDRLAVVGPNGAGKTTLLKLLYGIFQPTTGTVTREGRVDALFNINLGFRQEVSGRRNIVLRGLMNGWSRQQIEERMEGIIDFSQLGEFIDMPFSTYSQGMGARLAFATATSFEPEILLMDEWIGAGDQDFAEQASQRLHGLVSKAGIIVLASHNNELVKRICNKAIVLKHGRLEAFLDTEEAFTEYLSPPKPAAALAAVKPSPAIRARPSAKR